MAFTKPIRHLMVIQEPARTHNKDGTANDDQWLTIQHEWAFISPLRGRERIEAKKIQSKVTHRIEMRFVRGITTEHRLLLGDRIFNIDAVLNKNEQNRDLEIEAVELV